MPLLGNPHCLLPRPVLVPGEYPHNIHTHTLDPQSPGLAALSVLPLHHPSVVSKGKWWFGQSCVSVYTMAVPPKLLPASGSLRALKMWSGILGVDGESPWGPKAGSFGRLV